MSGEAAASGADYGSTASGSSFYAAMRVLPAAQREAMFQIYSFCRQVDDIADSAGTLCNAASALREKGAKSVSAYVTHGVLSNGAVQRVKASPLKAMVTTDSIMATEAMKGAKNLRQITIAPLLAEAIQRISEERSVSSLFD